MNSIKASFLTPLVLALSFASLSQEKIDVEKYNIEIPNVPSLRESHAKVTLINGQKLKGTITSISENSIQLEKVVYRNSKGGNPDSQKSKSLSFNEINYKDIQDIKIRGSVGETIGGFFVGTAVGVFVGGLGGLAIQCEDCNLDERLGLIILFAGIGGAIVGPIGAIDGPFHVHVRISGQYGNFQKFKNEMDGKEIRRQKRLRR